MEFITDLAESLNNLASLYIQNGINFNRAEELYLEASKIWGETKGGNDVYYAISLNNLGGLYRNTKKYKEAER